MDLITALQITPPSLAARSVRPPCDEITERVPGDASLNRALAIVFECLLDQSTVTGRLGVMDTALDAWGRNHTLFFDRLLSLQPTKQSAQGWNELLAVLHRWRDQIVDDFLAPAPRHILVSTIVDGKTVAIPDWLIGIADDPSVGVA